MAAKDGSRRWYWEASWRHEGRQHKRRLGEAWIRPRATPVDVKGWSAKYEKRPGNPGRDELTPQQAIVAMRDLIVAQAAAAPGTGRPRTFRQAAQAWLEEPHARSHSWTPETYAFNRGLLAEPGDDERRGRILRAFGDRRVDRISADDVGGYLRGLDGEVAPRTVNAHRQVLASVFADAAARGWGEGNPATAVAKRRQPAAPSLEVFTCDQVEAIAQAAGGELGALIVVAAMTGLRRGELVALRWRDVRFDQPALHVERAVSDGQIKRPKSGTHRTVPLADRPLEVLRELSARRWWTGPDDLVFPGQDGGMRHPDAVSQAFTRARDAAGAPGLRFHDLRHTFGTLLARAGVTGFDIQAWMGHSSYTTTQRYLHHAPRHGDAARLTAALTPV